MVKLPWIPSEADWLRLLAVLADEPIRNRVMLALAYDAVALENDVRKDRRRNPRDSLHKYISRISGAGH